MISFRASVGVLPLDVYSESSVLVDSSVQALSGVVVSGRRDSQFRRYLDLISRLEDGLTDEEATVMLGIRRHVVPARRADVMKKYPGLIVGAGSRNGCQVWKCTTISKFQPLGEVFP